MKNDRHESLAGALLRALEALPGADDDSDPAAAAPPARRERAGEAVLMALSQWMENEYSDGGSLDPGGAELRAELRAKLDDLLADVGMDTEPGRRSAGPKVAASRQTPPPLEAGSHIAIPQNVSPQLAQKLAAKLAAGSGGRAGTSSVAMPVNPGAKKPAPQRGEAATRPTMLGNRYELVTRIHQGAYTSVWRGIDTNAAIGAQPIAIKLIEAAHAQAIDNAALDAVVALSPTPELMTLRAHGREGEWHYQVADWIEGQTLESLLRSRADSLSFLADLPDWMDQLAQALEAVHGAGLVHGDVKPANAMICNNHTACLIDFDSMQRAGTSTQQRSLTPAFASPEAMTGAPADPRDDVYSLTVIAFRLLTGHLPHGRLGSAVDGHPQPPPTRPDGLSMTQWQALRRGLEPARQRRTSSAVTLVGELWDSSRGIAASQAPQRATSAGRRRIPRIRLLAGGVLAVLTVAALVLVRPQLLGSNYSAPVLEVRERLWPSETGVSPMVATADLGDDDPEIADTPTARNPDPDVPARDEAARAGAGALLDEPFDPPVNPSQEDPPEVPLDSASTLPAEPPLDEDVIVDAAIADADMQDSSPSEPASPEATPTAPAPAPAPAPAATERVSSDAPQQPPRVSFIESRMQVMWTAPAAMVQLRRTGSLAAPMTVAFEIEPGSAEPDEDFVAPLSSTVTFAAGQDTAMIVIPLVQSSESRETRSLWVQLIGNSTDPDGFNETQVILRRPD